MEGSKLPKPSGLRQPQIKTLKPLHEQKLNRMLSNVGATSSRIKSLHPAPRRSKSVADLRTIEQMNKPIFPKMTRVQTTRPQVTKPAPKRKAEKSNEDIKPKIVKQAKIPDWDYKGRYNQLREKYTRVDEEYKKCLSKLEELKDLEEKYNNIQDQHSKLENMHVKLTTASKEQENEIISLSTKVSVLEVNLSAQKKEKEELKHSYEELLESNITNSEKIEELSQQIEFLTGVQREHEQLKLEHKKLQSDFAMLKIDYDKINSERATLSSNLAAESNLKKALSYELSLLKQDFLKGEVGRRKLHNLVQDLKGNIRVFCRVRPPISVEETERLQCLINYVDEKTLEIRRSRESISTTSGKPTDLKVEFAFDRVFEPHSSQDEIFEDLAQLVQSALDGYDVCVFAYGQTGSGKTYTMQGGESQESAGMIPRTVELIFKSIKNLRRAGWVYEVKASFLEIYNESVRDLLNPNCTENLEIRYNEGKGTTVTNLKIESITTADELKNKMIEAQTNRAVAATDFNEHSSRSHAVTKIYLHGVNEETAVCYTGAINLVDLAGSESAKTSANERLTETININKSLSNLGGVMLALYNKEKHIPYRNSKLTYLLQSSLGGNSKTLMVVNISPFEECYAESINSLRFATKVKEVKMSIKRNKAITK